MTTIQDLGIWDRCTGWGHTDGNIGASDISEFDTYAEFVADIGTASIDDLIESDGDRGQRIRTPKYPRPNPDFNRDAIQEEGISAGDFIESALLQPTDWAAGEGLGQRPFGYSPSDLDSNDPEFQSELTFRDGTSIQFGTYLEGHRDLDDVYDASKREEITIELVRNGIIDRTSGWGHTDTPDNEDEGGFNRNTRSDAMIVDWDQLRLGDWGSIG